MTNRLKKRAVLTFIPILRALRTTRARPIIAAGLGIAALVAGGAVTQPTAVGVAPGGTSQSAAAAPASIVALQPFRTTETVQRADGREIALTSLNPNVNAWFLLRLGTAGSGDGETYHLENPAPGRETLRLVPGSNPRLEIALDGRTIACAPWAQGDKELLAARSGGFPFAPICGGHLFLRNPVAGHSTRLEQTASFIRNNVVGGEAIVNLVKTLFFKDAFRVVAPGPLAAPVTVTGGIAGGPPPARSRHYSVRTEIGLRLEQPRLGEMALGQWYALSGVPGVYASAIQPGVIDAAVLNGPGTTNPLDRVEAGSMDYLVAFDLSRFRLGYAVGTSNPGLGWSPRPPASVRPTGWAGPDGLGSPAPLVRLGMLDPVLAPRVVATFAAGFKRRHGAFKTGPLSRINHGSHYGFIQQGVVLSTLQPGLATLLVMEDGSIRMKTWSVADNLLLPHVRFARQNGVPLLEADPAGGVGVPGGLVSKSEDGNWSGSANNRLRTLRAGACMIGRGERAYLVYAFFSTATPSAMARTFRAYGCAYAMLLDMNALEHTYFAIYDRSNGTRRIEHLMPGMAAVDRRDGNGGRQARFVDYPDNRDFFYILSR